MVKNPGMDFMMEAFDAAPKSDDLMMDDLLHIFQEHDDRLDIWVFGTDVSVAYREVMKKARAILEKRIGRSPNDNKRLQNILAELSQQPDNEEDFLL